MQYNAPLLPNSSYHIFSRAIGNEVLFREEKNYQFFLQKYHQHTSPIADTFAWCLLPNHFHFLINIRSEESIKEQFGLIKSGKEFNFNIISDFLMERFSNWLNSYAKAFNKVYHRKGSLFIDYMRRVEVTSNSQLLSTVFYIHKNPVHHGLVKNIEEWQWSSYNEYAIPNSLENTSEVLNLFDGVEGFLQYHRQPISLKEAIIIE